MFANEILMKKSFQSLSDKVIVVVYYSYLNCFQYSK